MISEKEGRYLATNLMQSAKYAGEIKQEPCWICGELNTHAHHPDYREYDQIQWLCPKCHSRVHRSGLKCNKPPHVITFRPDTWPPQRRKDDSVQICSVLPRDIHTWLLYIQVSDQRETFTAALTSILRKAKEDSETDNTPTS